MREIGRQPTNPLNQTPLSLGKPSVRPNRVFALVPLGGLFGLMGVTSIYRPLDGAPFFWLGFALCLAAAFLISHLQQKSKRGDDISSFFPAIYWLALGPAAVGLALWVNGAMDHSAIESHQETVTRKFVVRGRGGPSYHIELTSWRPNRMSEEVTVSYKLYQRLHTDGPIVIDLHKGALRIAWVGAVREPD
jgi:hypothetical protein